MRRLPQLRNVLMIDGVLPCALAALLLDAALMAGIDAPRPVLGSVIAVGIIAVAWLSWRRLVARTAQRMRDASVALEAIAAGKRVPGIGVLDTREAAALAHATQRVAQAMRAILARENEADVETLSTLQQAQAARRSKAYFLAAVGDHFRQPLQAMQLFAARLTPGADTSGRAFDPLQKCVDDMARLLGELLELSRLDAGIVFAHPHEVAVDRWLSDALEPLATRARASDATLVVRAGRRTTTCTDPELASQLLRRLVDNAIDHAPGGRILVAARVRGGTLNIEVRDNGPGIALIHQRRIFDEFVQLADADHAGGFGLGLTIARRVALVLRTHIQVRSALGAGSTFAFELVDLPVDQAGVPSAITPLHASG